MAAREFRRPMDVVLPRDDGGLLDMSPLTTEELEWIMSDYSGVAVVKALAYLELERRRNGDGTAASRL